MFDSADDCYRLSVSQLFIKAVTGFDEILSVHDPNHNNLFQREERL